MLAYMFPTELGEWEVSGGGCIYIGAIGFGKGVYEKRLG
jgi:hypothetical protein